MTHYIDLMFDKLGSIMGVSKEEYEKAMKMPFDSELTRLNETYLEKKDEAEEAEFCFKAAVLAKAMKLQGILK